MKNVIITGATGMVGNIILQHCINSSEVKEIRSISRKPSGQNHGKLKEFIIQDFMDYQAIEEAFDQIDAAYFCLGAYTGTVNEDLFKKITYDFAASFADMLHTKSPQSTFCLLSGQGADQKEKSRIAFARFKGMAENYLLAKNFGEFYSFRPGYIYPVEPREEPNFMYKLSRWLYPVLKIAGKNYSVKSTELGEAMFKTGLKGAQKTILENSDILELL